MSAVFSTPMAALFKTGMAVPARYQFNTENPVFLRVIPRNPDVAADIFQTEIRRQAAFYDCLVSDLPTPSKGAVVTISGRDYRILDARHADSGRIIWVLNCEVIG